MRRQLFKPLKWKTRVFAAQISELNDYFPLFPKRVNPDDTHITPTKFSNDEKLEILEFGSPTLFCKEMLWQGFDPFSNDERQFIQFCERLETIDHYQSQSSHFSINPHSHAGLTIDIDNSTTVDDSSTSENNFTDT